MRVAQHSYERDPGVRKADQMPAQGPPNVGSQVTGLGEPRQGTHLSMLRTTHPRCSEGALVSGIKDAVGRDYPVISGTRGAVSRDYPGFAGTKGTVSRDYPAFGPRAI